MTVINGVEIEIHADDYGQTLNTSKDILELMKGGHLDGISILPNMSVCDDCIDLLKQSIKELPFLPLMSVHIDLVEGLMLSEAGKLIPWSWKDLFLYSLPFVGNSKFAQIKNEVRAQIKKGNEIIKELQNIAEKEGICFTPQKLRVDSHQHAHMLPVVWKAIMQVVCEDNYELEYIRNSHELISPFIKNTKGSHWRPVNIIKNRLLAIYAPKVESFDKTNHIKPMYLWGLIMSGHMDLERIKKVMPFMLKKCEEKGFSLELNIHPGKMLEEEQSKEVPDISAKDFYLTDDRRVEYDTVFNIHTYLNSIK